MIFALTIPARAKSVIGYDYSNSILFSPYYLPHYFDRRNRILNIFLQLTI